MQARVGVESVRKGLDSWHFWVGVAFVGFVIGVVTLVLLLGRIEAISADDVRDEAVQGATAAAAYRRCVDGIPQARRVNQYLRGVRELAEVLLENAQDALLQTPLNSPMRASRQRSFNRLVAAHTAIFGLEDFPVPTVEECAARLQP